VCVCVCCVVCICVCCVCVVCIFVGGVCVRGMCGVYVCVCARTGGHTLLWVLTSCSHEDTSRRIGAHPHGLMSADRVCRALCPGEPTVTVQGMRTTAHLCREHNPTRTKHLCEPRLQRDYLLRSGETSRQPCISHLLLCDKGAPCPALSHGQWPLLPSQKLIWRPQAQRQVVPGLRHPRVTEPTGSSSRWMGSRRGQWGLTGVSTLF